MPAAFIGHGSPMNALETNRYTAAWREFGRSVLESFGEPRAILAISAHWYINATAVTAMARPRTIHDFYGFPAELFDVQYPATGTAGARRGDRRRGRADLGGRRPRQLGHRPRHLVGAGARLPGLHSVPVVQLSINAYKPLEYHLELGAKLAALRERGVLIVGSGNVVHNLGAMDPSLQDGGFGWAQRFDDVARAQVLDDPAAAVRLQEHGDYQAAVPTPDHFIPLLYFAGLAAAHDGGAGVLTDGCAYGSLSMTSYTLGAVAVCRLARHAVSRSARTRTAPSASAAATDRARRARTHARYR